MSIFGTIYFCMYVQYLVQFFVYSEKPEKIEGVDMYDM